MTIFKKKISATMAGLLMVGCMQITAMPSKANEFDEGVDSSVATVSDATPGDATTDNAESGLCVLPEIRITSETTSVTVGDLPSFSVNMETEHASIEYEGKTGWAYKYTSELAWHGFGYNPLIARADDELNYAIRVCVNVDDGYALQDGKTRIIFNGIDITETTMSAIETLSYGGFVYIDLGHALQQQILPEIRITSETTVVQEGALVPFTVDTSTEHASIEYEGKTGWAYKYASELDWHGFGYNPLIAKADGARHYALGVCIFTDKDYILKNGTTKIIFNGVDVTTSTMSCISERPWGGFVYIDLGMAVKESLEGWQQVAGKWQFFVDGEPKTGWICDEDKWYFMDANGIMQTGWVSSGNKWYYLANSGAMVTGWKQIKNKWYYFNTNGAMVTGWKQINNKWYHFNTSGAMATGWNLINDKWYYFNADGAMQTGWQKYNNEWYYLTVDGVMTTGWLKYKNEWYYFKASGVMVTGKQVINGKTYNFNSSGVWVN